MALTDAEKRMIGGSDPAESYSMCSICLTWHLEERLETFSGRLLCVLCWPEETS